MPAINPIDQTETLSSLPPIIQTVGNVAIRPPEAVPIAPAGSEPSAP